MPQDEILKVQFDKFKHLSTVCIALGVLLFTITDSVEAEAWLVGATMFLIAVSFLASIYGLVAVTTAMRHADRDTSINYLEEIAIVGLAAAVITFAIYAVLLPVWAGAILGAGVLLWEAICWIRKRKVTSKT